MVKLDLRNKQTPNVPTQTFGGSEINGIHEKELSLVHKPGNNKVSLEFLNCQLGNQEIMCAAAYWSLDPSVI
jgi:hypothetical protein